ncbi:MAG: hypothetical protein ACJAXT_002191, partial [Paracoccaceae bacterium]
MYEDRLCHSRDAQLRLKATWEEITMNALLDTVDPDGLLEYSVVFTDRSLNHMSASFRGVMT